MKYTDKLIRPTKYQYTLQRLKPKEVKQLVQRGSGISIGSSSDSCDRLTESSKDNSAATNYYTESDDLTRNFDSESVESNLRLCRRCCSDQSKSVSSYGVNQESNCICSTESNTRIPKTQNIVCNKNNIKPLTIVVTNKLKEPDNCRSKGLSERRSKYIDDQKTDVKAQANIRREPTEDLQDESTHTLDQLCLGNPQDKKLNSANQPTSRHVEQNRYHTLQEKKLIDDLELQNIIGTQKDKVNIKSKLPENPSLGRGNTPIELYKQEVNKKKPSHSDSCFCAQPCANCCKFESPTNKISRLQENLTKTTCNCEKSYQEFDETCSLCKSSFNGTKLNKLHTASILPTDSVLDKGSKQQEEIEKRNFKDNTVFKKNGSPKQRDAICICDIDVNKCICEQQNSIQGFDEGNAQDFSKTSNSLDVPKSVKSRIKNFNAGFKHTSEDIGISSDSNNSKLIRVFNRDSNEKSFYSSPRISGKSRYTCICKNKLCTCPASEAVNKDIINIYNSNNFSNVATAEIVSCDDQFDSTPIWEPLMSGDKNLFSIEIAKEIQAKAKSAKESKPNHLRKELPSGSGNNYSVRPIDVISTVVTKVPKSKPNKPVLLDVEIFPTMEHPNGLKPKQHKVVVKSYGPSRDKYCENKSTADVRSHMPRYNSDVDRRLYNKCCDYSDDWDTYFEPESVNDSRNGHSINQSYAPPRLNNVGQRCSCYCSYCNSNKNKTATGNRMQQSSSQTTPSIYGSRGPSPVPCNCCKCRMGSPHRFKNVNRQKVHMDRSTNTSQNNLYRGKHCSRSEVNGICRCSCTCNKYLPQAPSRQYTESSNISPRYCNLTSPDYDRSPNQASNCTCDHCMRNDPNIAVPNREFDKLPYEKHKKYGELVNELQHELGARKILNNIEEGHFRGKCRLNDSNSWSNKDEFCRSDCALYQERIKEKREQDRKCCSSAEHDRHLIERGRVEKHISKFNSNQDCWTVPK